jgi:hypothetical protein
MAASYSTEVLELSGSSSLQQKAIAMTMKREGVENFIAWSFVSTNFGRNKTQNQ